MKKMKPVPPEVVAEAIRELNPAIVRLLDADKEYTETETTVLLWFAKFHTLMQPYVGAIPLPASTQGNKGG